MIFPGGPGWLLITGQLYHGYNGSKKTIIISIFIIAFIAVIFLATIGGHHGDHRNNKIKHYHKNHKHKCTVYNHNYNR